MNERSLHNIRTYLQNEDVQERIRQNIQRGHLEATVTIGRAARLFGFTENQLRDWEDRGLLKPLRPTGPTGQRQYSPAELDKLAIIKELMDEGGYAPGSIPADVDRVWDLVSSEPKVQVSSDGVNRTEYLHLDQRIDKANEESFWRYYGSHVLRLSLMLICEDLPETIAGLILPLRENGISASIRHTSDLPRVGESLIGWLGWNRSFYTFLEPAPSFEYPTDFRVVPLKATEEDSAKDNTLIVVQRKAKPLILSISVVEIVRRLLAPLYQVKDWRPYFGQGMRDLLYLAPDFNSSGNLLDDTLNGFADMIVRLGGQTDDGQDRWRFCCILLPENPKLPLQQRSLIVRAQSKHSPHEVGVTVISPDKYVNSPTLRAYQSGHIVYQPEIAAKDTAIALRELEGPIQSVVALSVGGESGEPIAVLYVVSDQEHSFSLEDRRILRMMASIVEEVLMTYQARQQVTDKLRDLIKKPDVIDALFENFLSENDFHADVEKLLKEIKKRMAESGKQLAKEEITYTDLSTQPRTDESESGKSFLSLIAVDIDNQSNLSNRYGDRVTRSLTYEVGGRILDELRGSNQRLYHIYADRFYITLLGRTLEQAREKAQELKKALAGPYRFDAMRISGDQQAGTASMLVLSDIAVRLGVASFSYSKLEDLLQRYATGTSGIEVREIITRALDQALEKGRDEGGDVIITWNPEIRGFEPLPEIRGFEPL